MPRGYTVATVALALHSPTKWVDNVLSHHQIDGVTQARQGIARRVSFDGALHLSVLHALSSELRIPLELATEAARQLVRAGKWSTGAGLTLTLDRENALKDLHLRLGSAVETAPVPQRGRPPGNAKRGA